MEALSVMDRNNRKLLVICDGDCFKGVVSIGDIQRAILKKADLTSQVKNYGRTSITVAYTDDDIESVKELMRTNRIEAMPVIDHEERLVDIIEWDDIFEKRPLNAEPLNLPVVIMAGGKGTRLLPLTNVIPKPLLPISDKTIIEEIIDRFMNAGCDRFFISVNYLMEAIETFFSEKKFDVEFIHEERPLGTGGALYYLKDYVNSTFFVINCDTLVDIDLNDLLNYHKENGNLITVVSALKSMHIPYGTIETEDNGIIKGMKEKPDYVYQVNAGLYILEPDVLKYIEKDRFLNITDLINKAISCGDQVGAFPVPEGAWVDIGNWDEYLKVVNNYLLKSLK
jgi:dTDP-glucose pyrophosphorylase